MRAKSIQTDRQPQDEAGAGSRREIAAAPHRKGTYAPLNISVSFRRQTPEEQRQFGAAFNVFLNELVRQQLGRKRLS
jgi:hypothetical protein